MAQNRRKALHYRNAILFNDGNLDSDRSLQKILSGALSNSFKTVESRCYFFDSAHRNYRADPHIFISDIRDDFGMLCLEIVYVEPGVGVPVIQANYSADSLACEAICPLPSDGTEREYVDSLAYIAILENHCIIMQSKTINFKLIESYINYLLLDAQLLSENQSFWLHANNRGLSSFNLEDKLVKNVKLSFPMELNGASSEINTSRNLLALLISQSRMADVIGRAQIDISDIDIEINLGYKYSTSTNNEKILARIAQDLIDNRDDEIVVEIKGAGKYVGSQELQLKEQFQISFINSLPDKNDVYENMAKWLVDLLEKGMVEP